MRVAAGAAAVLIGVTLAPPEAQALEIAEARAAAYRVVESAKADAAKARVPAAPLPAEDPAEPLAEARLEAGRAQELVAEGAGVAAEFSGFEAPGALDLSLTAAGDAAEVSAASETGGTVVGAAVEITALQGDGSEVTEFPAEVETVTDEHGVESTAAITPGIALGFDVDQAAVRQAGLDPATLRIYTRESDGEPWLQLPSYFDADEGRVVGESDHLSQFVVIGVKFVPPPGPRIVLDPDDDYGWAETPAPASELNYNVALANSVAAKLSQACLAQVVVTRQADVRFVSGATRAAIAASYDPTATVTIAFDAVTGSAWGTESDGGTYLYSRGGSSDNALADALVGAMPAYTGRPAGYRPANGIFPDPAFAGVPGAMAHMETLYLDHNYDRAVIDNGFDHVSNGVLVGIAQYAQSLGFNCTDPVRGGLPGPPSAAELARWRHLGYQNYQTYGADPVSFSTGNLVEDEPLFTLPGLGDQETDFTLVYNSQDGRLSRVGAGWSFALGGRAQRFDDGSVLVVRGDGASFAFQADGAGGYDGEEGLGLTLREAGAGFLELRSDAGESWRYDAADIEGIGELVSHTDRQGNTTRLTYGSADENAHQFVSLASVTDQAGQTVAVENDAAGRITAFTHPDGRKWRLAYNDAGDLVSITGPDGGVRAFTYDREHRMITATDALGVTYLKNEYDSAGRVTKQWDADGNLRTFKYGDGTTTYTDNEGQVSVFSWDKQKRITRVEDAAGGVTGFSFDKANRVTEAVEPDEAVTAYEYDDRGNVIRETGPDGGEWKFTWTPTGELVSATDPLGRTTTHEVNAQGLTTRSVDPAGGVTEYGYTARGDLARVTHPSGSTETFAYDGRGNVVSHVSPAGRTTAYAYDAANRLISETDGTGATTSYAYDAADNLVAATDPLGNTTSYGYDLNGHLLTETAADGGVTSYAWDALFRLAKVTDPEGGVTKYRYNTEDALIGTVDPVGAETRYDVDPLGRVTAVTDPLGGVWGATLDDAGRVASETDPLGREQQSGYDELGQLVSQTDAEGGEWKYTYDGVGNLVSQTDPEGGETRLVYDELDRLVEQVDADGRSTAYEYDADGGLVKVIDPVGAATEFTLDADGLVLVQADALGGQTVFEYDPAGRAVASTDPIGARTEYGYDAAGRQTLMRDALGGETLTGYDPVGRVTKVTDPAGHTSEIRYDLAGRTVQAVDPLGAVTEYGYDLAGQQTSTTDADGRETAYGYDLARQLIQVVEGHRPGEDADSDTNVTTAYTYTAAGELETITDPAGGESRFEYDKAGRPVKQTDAAGVTSAVGYDKAGRVIVQANGAGQKLTTEYTKAGLVASTSSPTGETTFDYDAAGRPVAMQDSQGATAWRYDELGRMVSETSSADRRTALSYDAAGRIEQLTLPDGGVIGYAYDSLGRMTGQETPWGDLGYAWNVDSTLAEITRAGGVTSSYVYDAADRVTQITHAEPETAPAPVEPPAKVKALQKDAAVCPVDGTAGYLKSRTLQNLEGEDELCVKTADYLGRRALPAPVDPVLQGGTLQYSYGYSAAGQVVEAGRVIDAPVDVLPGQEDADSEAGEDTDAGVGAGREVLEALQTTYTYDGVGRLATSTLVERSPQGAVETTCPSSSCAESQDPPGRTFATTTYGYDPLGNRVSAKTVTPEESTQLTQEFDAGNRLTQRTTTGGTAAGTRTFGYDSAGRRTTERGAGVDADYEYGYGGQPTRVRTGDRTTTYGYDGLSRPVAETVNTPHSSDTAATSYLAGAPVERSSALHGGSTFLWDALGEVAGISSDTSDEARWALLDRLSSVVAEATGTGGADISQLVSYGDYGMPRFETTGHSQPYGYTGELQDGATGTVSFGSRAYDPAGVTWHAPDAWPGLLTTPQSLNRYGYVLGDPITLIDEGGYRPRHPYHSPKPQGVYRRVNASAAANHVDNRAWGASTRKVAPSVFNHSALANHVDNPSYFAATGRSIVSPAALSGPFMQERHRTAHRPTAACAGSVTNRWVAQACAAQTIKPVDWVQAGEDIQAWARSDAGRNASFWLGTASIVLPLIGSRFGPQGAGVGVVLGTATSTASVGIDCLAALKSPACVIGAIGITSGPVGTIASRLPQLGVHGSESVVWVSKIIGWNSDALTWIPAFADWWDRELW